MSAVYCENCRYFDVLSFPEKTLLRCRRHPEPIARERFDWCGEWKGRDDIQREAELEKFLLGMWEWARKSMSDGDEAGRDEPSRPDDLPTTADIEHPAWMDAYGRVRHLGIWGPYRVWYGLDITSNTFWHGDDHHLLISPGIDLPDWMPQ